MYNVFIFACTLIQQIKMINVFIMIIKKITKKILLKRKKKTKQFHSRKKKIQNPFLILNILFFLIENFKFYFNNKIFFCGIA